tara:strand:+ start:122 stop:1330 length:1209 start_codon:yes stop_codon:yes gene_type:complete
MIQNQRFTSNPEDAAMDIENSITIRRAKLTDREELLALYLTVYGDDYPLELGTNKQLMTRLLEEQEKAFWFVVELADRPGIAASCVVELEPEFRIGKVTGAAVHPQCAGLGLSSKLIGFAVNEVMAKAPSINTLYATTRTVTMASQKMLISNGFKPLGIFPNARKIKTYETLTLMGYFREGVLDKRTPVQRIPPSLVELYLQTNKSIGDEREIELVEDCPAFPKNIAHEESKWEFIQAPEFVEKRFNEVFQGDRESTFYPFHKPNLLISNTVLGVEMFASFNKKDHYCVLISANCPITTINGHFKKLAFAFKEIGIYYLETLVRIDYFEAVCFLGANRFLPSAYYPAMREIDGVAHDYVLMTRTMVPLDFSESQISSEFTPFVREYVRQWIDLNLSTVGVHL